MLSPEDLLKYPYFAGIPDQSLEALASLCSLRQFSAGERLFEERGIAKHLMIVKSGQVDIVYMLGDGREVVAESAVSGDLIAWSAVLAPHQLTGSGVGFKSGELIKIEGERLRSLCDQDILLGYRLMTEIAKGLRDRLTGLRVQLVATM